MPTDLTHLTATTAKHDLLATLVPPAALHELAELRSQGVDVARSTTDDPAYDRPLAIRDVFVDLEHRSRSFDEASTGTAARLAAGAAQHSVGAIRSWGRRSTLRHRARADDVRRRLLYDLPEVQGGPWLRQAGRAASLVTVVDALDLATTTSGGAHPRMSGRLDEALLDLTFGAQTGWLEGRPLVDAVIESAIRFRGHTPDHARSSAATTMTALADFVTAPPKPGFQQVVGFCVDALGIRSRKEEVRREIHRHAQETDADDLLLLSIGCGTALPMLEALESLHAVGRRGRLVLVDQDPVALASAQLLASQLGLTDAIEIHCRPLFVGRGRRTRLLDLDTVLTGRRVDVCEDSGLREYFPDRLYVELATKAWQATKPGGLVTTGNMNTNRPQAQALHGLLGWPIPVRMRTISQVRALHLRAGIPADLLRLRLTQEGVYTLCFMTRPPESTTQ